MNLYIIVEGKTEKVVYPNWISHLIPRLKRIMFPSEATENNYYLFNGGGYPHLLYNHLRNSIADVNEYKQYNYLVIILDVDEATVEGIKEEVYNFIEREELSLQNAELVIIPQNRCIETWFLGNRKIFKSNPQSAELRKYVDYYNVKEQNPELMGFLPPFSTHAQFHADYCAEFLREKNISYSKNHPRGVTDESYLENLIQREKDTTHLASFKTFIKFCDKIKSELENSTY